MSAFEKPKVAEQNWAEDSDEDEQIEGGTWHDTGRSPMPTGAPNNETNDDLFEGEDSEEEESDESSDEDDEVIDTNGHSENKSSSNTSAGSAAGAAAAATKKPVPDVSQLSKKERQALKAKELDDLDSILAEVGIAAPNSKPVAPEIGAGGIKKKKPKKKDAGVESVTQPVAEAPVETVKDVKAVLALKKAASAKKTTDSASRAAVAEALKAVEAEKASKKRKGEAAKAAKATFDR